ncbi:MAG: hypothetical protein KAY37_09310 [Phycisphaerae bacterium]|nr:hypothetical protein [Phycisphaerae bacterium]
MPTPKKNRVSVRSAVCCTALLAVALAGLAATGCQTTLSHATTQPAVPRDSNAELVLYISDQSFITAEPAYRAVYLLAKGAPFTGEFDELTETLRAERLIGRWVYPSDRILDRAAVGFMICRACRIRTGLNWNLTGLGRYAWRELIYHKIAAGGSELNYMSGGEFVGLLARAEDYLARTGKHDAQPVELGSEGE